MIIHTVKKDDSIFSISRKYSVSPSKIIEDNLLKNPDSLSVGEALIIPNATKIHTVRGGETLSSIEQKYNVKRGYIQRSNPSLFGESIIYPGQILTVSSPPPLFGAIGTYGLLRGGINEKSVGSVLPYLTYASAYPSPFFEIERETTDEKILKSLAEKYSFMPVLCVANTDIYGNYIPEIAKVAIEAADTPEKTVTSAVNKGYHAINLDFEFIPSELETPYTEFAERLCKLCKEHGLYLFISVPTPTEQKRDSRHAGINARELYNFCDTLIVMSYEFSHQYDNGGCLCPANLFRETAEKFLEFAIGKKIIMSMPDYAYDFSPGGENTLLTYQSAMENIKKHRAEIKYTVTDRCPYANYYKRNAGSTVEHMITFENASSYMKKCEIIYENALGGICIYPANTLNPQLFSVINSMFNIIKP